MSCHAITALHCPTTTTFTFRQTNPCLNFLFLDRLFDIIPIHPSMQRQTLDLPYFPNAMRNNKQTNKQTNKQANDGALLYSFHFIVRMEDE
jgi:hypothetical protein